MRLLNESRDEDMVRVVGCGRGGCRCGTIRGISRDDYHLLEMERDRVPEVPKELARPGTMQSEIERV